MILENRSEVEKVIEKLNKFFDLEEYSDFLFLNFEEFNFKYGYYGFSFSDFVCVRFYEDPNIVSEICKLLSESQYYLILLAKDKYEVRKLEKTDLEKMLMDNSDSNFVIFEPRLTWLLVFDQHRKLFGLGNYIKKKMKKHVDLRFGEVKIEYVSSDKPEMTNSLTS